MSELQPFVLTLVSDALCVNRSDHPFLRYLASKELRPLEAFLYYQSMRFLLLQRDEDLQQMWRAVHPSQETPLSPSLPSTSSPSAYRDQEGWRKLSAGLLQLSFRALRVQSAADHCATERAIPTLWLKYARSVSNLEMLDPAVAVRRGRDGGTAVEREHKNRDSKERSTNQNQNQNQGTAEAEAEAGSDADDYQSNFHSQLFVEFVSKNVGLSVDSFQGAVQSQLLRRGRLLELVHCVATSGSAAGASCDSLVQLDELSSLSSPSAISSLCTPTLRSVSFGEQPDTDATNSCLKLLYALRKALVNTARSVLDRHSTVLQIVSEVQFGSATAAVTANSPVPPSSAPHPSLCSTAVTSGSVSGSASGSMSGSMSGSVPLAWRTLLWYGLAHLRSSSTGRRCSPVNGTVASPGIQPIPANNSVDCSLVLPSSSLFSVLKSLHQTNRHEIAMTVATSIRYIAVSFFQVTLNYCSDSLTHNVIVCEKPEKLRLKAFVSYYTVFICSCSEFLTSFCILRQLPLNLYNRIAI